MTRDELLSLKVGDGVVRQFGNGIGNNTCVGLRVTAITETEIVCGAWTFSRETGGEIDADLGWDGVRVTGSMLVRRLEDHGRDTTY